MNKIAALFSVVALMGSVAVMADAKKPEAKKPTKTSAKVTEVWTCPIQGAPVKDHSAKGVSYKSAKGTYDVHFCCAGCPEEFAKLSDKDKQAKVDAAIKKDMAGKKGAKG